MIDPYRVGGSGTTHGLRQELSPVAKQKVVAGLLRTD